MQRSDVWNSGCNAVLLLPLCPNIVEANKSRIPRDAAEPHARNFDRRRIPVIRVLVCWFISNRPESCRRTNPKEDKIRPVRAARRYWLPVFALPGQDARAAADLKLPGIPA